LEVGWTTGGWMDNRRLDEQQEVLVVNADFGEVWYIVNDTMLFGKMNFITH